MKPSSQHKPMQLRSERPNPNHLCTIILGGPPSSLATPQQTVIIIITNYQAHKSSKQVLQLQSEQQPSLTAAKAILIANMTLDLRRVGGANVFKKQKTHSYRFKFKETSLLYLFSSAFLYTFHKRKYLSCRSVESTLVSIYLL